MDARQNTTRSCSGTSMIEVLVTLVILMIGLLGLAGLQLQAQHSEAESFQRVQALILLQDMVGRINANRKSAACYAFTTDAVNGTPFLGTGATATPACANAQAVQDMNDWSALLTGAAETTSGNNVGAMIGGRGCISYDAASQAYLVSVAWQGLGSTAAPPASLGCGKDMYGDETQRRVISLTLRIASLL